MSGSNSSSTMTRNNGLLFTGTELEHSDIAPPEMRENYYFCLLITNLNRCTTTQVLQSVFGSLPGFIHDSVDVDTKGEPVGTGEAIFTDEMTMSETAIKMENHIIDGIRLQFVR
ncbi:hypothetical protein KSP39_PZI004962 [Platanthera zijinensis]|uniref:RRM domain-containing protein n=1 Tax=Platanthera zijinensis TaxID=2320716 RepID=A0AAP0GBA0_9ASPA